MKIRFLTAVAASASALALLSGCATAESQPTSPAVEEPAQAAQAETPNEQPQEEPAADTASEKKQLSDAEQHDLDTQLIAAAWANDVTEAARLIEAGANVNAKDSTVQSAYLVATSEGYLSLLDLTLEHGADVTSLDSWDGTGLIRSAERGHTNVVGRLLQEGIAPDHVNNLGWVALHEALIYAKPDQVDNYVDTVRVLVAGGVDVTIAAERDGLTPLDLAQQNSLQPQEQLLRAAASASSLEQSAADEQLLDAARDGDPDQAALALRAGADLEAQNELQQTPLLLASANDHVAVAKLLVALGANPDALDHQHDTPWLVTGVTGSVSMLEALLPANPDMTIVNRYGGLSPIPAGERGHADYMARVVTTGVDLDHVNNLGWTALLEAVLLGDGSAPYVEIVHTLIDAGINVNIADNNGVTALEHARDRGFGEIASALEGAGSS